MNKSEFLNHKYAQVTKDKKSLLITLESGQKILIPLNLIKYQLEIPYTKKDGTAVTEKEIKQMKKELKKAA